MHKRGRRLATVHASRAGTRKTYYAAFDLLWLNGKDLRSQPLEERKRRLFQIIPKNTRIIPIRHFETKGKELFQAVQDYDLEGIVAKRRTDPYNSLAKWYKIKSPTYSQAEGRGDFVNPSPTKRQAGCIM